MLNGLGKREAASAWSPFERPLALPRGTGHVHQQHELFSIRFSQGALKPAKLTQFKQGRFVFSAIG